MCNLYTMTATVDEMRRVFGPFTGDTANLPPFDEIYPGKRAPVLRREGAGLKLDMMSWGFPGPAAARGRPVTNVRNLASPFWRSAIASPERRCIVPVTRFCEWTGEVGAKRKVWFGLSDEAEPLFAFAGIWRPGEGGRAVHGLPDLRSERRPSARSIPRRCRSCFAQRTSAAGWTASGNRPAPLPFRSKTPTCA